MKRKADMKLVTHLSLLSTSLTLNGLLAGAIVLLLVVGHRRTRLQRWPSTDRRCDEQLPLATVDVQECVALILAQVAVASQLEIPGLTSALGCILSLDERDGGQLVAQARSGTGSTRREQAAPLIAERQQRAD
jgi:hypothetical protein